MKKQNHQVVAVSIVVGLLSGGAGAIERSKADVVLHNATVYTVNSKQPWAQAVAIDDGKIVYVGDVASIRRARSLSSG